jgi:hypothetical protein
VRPGVGHAGETARGIARRVVAIGRFRAAPNIARVAAHDRAAAGAGRSDGHTAETKRHWG